MKAKTKWKNETSVSPLEKATCLVISTLGRDLGEVGGQRCGRHHGTQLGMTVVAVGKKNIGVVLSSNLGLIDRID